MIEFLTFKNQKGLIDGVKLHKLKIHRDPRGSLMETLREDWTEVFHRPDLQFGQSYYSVTLPGFARDEDLWHVHPKQQTDRFVVLMGNAVVGIYDWRKGSKTEEYLNLFLMGEANGDDNQYLLLIPLNLLHGFCTVGNQACHLISYPDQHYNTKEEGRIPFSQVGACFPDGAPFSWDLVRRAYKG